jgi:hypothetical protein
MLIQQAALTWLLFCIQPFIFSSGVLSLFTLFRQVSSPLNFKFAGFWRWIHEIGIQMSQQI